MLNKITFMSNTKESVIGKNALIPLELWGS